MPADGQASAGSTLPSFVSEASPEILAALLQVAPVMVVWADPDGRVRLVNDHLTRLTGWTPGQLGQRPLDRLLPDAAARETFWQAIQTADTGWLDIDVACADGTTLASSWNGQRLGDGTLLGVGLDMRRQVALRAALLRNIEQLQRVNQDLEAFIRAASHDLREPVRSLISFSQLLERRLAGVTDRDALDYLGFIVVNARRLLDLVAALKGYAQAGASTTLAPVDLSEAARAAEQALSELKRDTEGTVRIAPLPTVNGDEVLLREMLQNLIDNALRHHMPATPPVVTLSPHVAEDGWTGVAIADNGLGIPDSILRRGPLPFDRYTAPTVTAGLGMGLAIATRIAERHGARLWFERQAEGGSRVVVLFPPLAPTTFGVAEP